jgi:tRNA A-37 threonylcarbamoyl transferase component Bud32/membrane-associated phospholipid phosphatase
VMLASALVVSVLVTVFRSAPLFLEHVDSWITDRFVAIRTPWLTHVARGINALGSSPVDLALRWITIVLLVVFRRWRHLLTFIAAVLIVGWFGTSLTEFFGRLRPLGVPILAGWSGFSMPSAPVAFLSATLVGMALCLLPDGKIRARWLWTTDAVIVALGLARIYLGVDHPTDWLFGALFGMGITLVTFRLVTPEEVFPVSYRRGSAAHLDTGGARGEAIKRAVSEQLGLEVVSIEPFGWAGSGGSTPLRLQVAGEPPTELFGKLYAATHLRSDRNYKFTRAIMYGALEDEKSFHSVRQLVQYEDYLLRVMRDSGIPVAKSFGFVEITPQREYLILTEFLEGAREIGKDPVDVRVIDSALQTVRELWDAGIAHRDIKPANVLVRDGTALLIDVAFAEVRPTPWRQAVDLANMMLILGLHADPKLVVERALRLFTEDELAEAFAAARGVASPSQLRSEMKKSERDVLAEFRSLVPARRPIRIQRWSWRRIGLTFATLIGVLFVLTLILSNLQGAGLL